MNHPASVSAEPTAITIQEARTLVDDYLSEFFKAKIVRSQYIHTSYANLWESIDDLYRSGGKRFRPYMVLLSYGAAGGARDIADIVPAAAAQEALHFGTLMHDDIIDRDYTRHGVENISGRYRERYASYFADDVERTHFSNSAALLAGDLMMTSAFELLNRLPVNTSLLETATQTLSEAFFSVIGGELMDTESSFVDAPAGAEAIATYKTASYSFVGPLVMGAQLAEASEAYISKLTTFGTQLGVAFQLQDDLLGVFGDEAVVGKSTSTDLQEGKRTYLIECFYTRATQPQIAEFENYFGSGNASEASLEKLRHLLVGSGAKASTKERIDTLADEAAAILDTMELDVSHYEAFQTLISLSTKRAA